MISRWLVDRLSKTDPAKRRLYAARILVGSLAGWISSHVLFLLVGVDGLFEHVLNLISWWAITLTAWDILATPTSRSTPPRTARQNPLCPPTPRLASLPIEPVAKANPG